MPVTLATQIMSNFCLIPALYAKIPDFYAKVPALYSKIPAFYDDIHLFNSTAPVLYMEGFS